MQLERNMYLGISSAIGDLPVESRITYFRPAVYVAWTMFSNSNSELSTRSILQISLEQLGSCQFVHHGRYVLEVESDQYV
jgi:hypothetical protein